MRIKGMVLVSGKTYRIARVSSGVYDVTRILDDELVGTFKVGPPLVVVKAHGIEESLVREIGRAAVQAAKTSWMGRVTIP
jgi:hypothetical protein